MTSERGERPGEPAGADEVLSYPEALARIAELAEQLAAHADPVVAAAVGELLDWVDAFHRDGLGRLVSMIRTWRGEIFLEAVAADEVAGLLLEAYGLDGPPAGTAPPAAPSPNPSVPVHIRGHDA